MNRVCSIVINIGLLIFLFPVYACTAAPYIYVTNFEVTPSPINDGESATLLWNVSGATTVEINNGIGEVAPYGKLLIKPSQTTEYTLIASNSGRAARQTATVIVNARPVVPSTPQEPIPNIWATDSDTLLHYVGKDVFVRGNVTYISEWVPSRYSGWGSGAPWTFIFFMEDIFDGANYPGVEWGGGAGYSLYEKEAWRDQSGGFRAIIKPEYRPDFNSYLPNGYIEHMREPFINPAIFPSGFILQEPFPVIVHGIIVNYGRGTAMYLNYAHQMSIMKR